MLVNYSRENLFILDSNNTEIEGRFPSSASQNFSFEIVDRITENSNFDGAIVNLFKKNNLQDQYKEILNPLDESETIVFSLLKINVLVGEKCSKLEYFKFTLQNHSSQTKLYLRILFW